MKTLLVLMLAAFLTASCGRNKSGAASSQPTTQTISPAAAKPAPDGTDTMTQTVDVDDSRSESDGMAASDSTPAPKSGAAKRAPAKKKRK